MTKPEDIPQDVWDRAIAIETGYEGGANGRRPIFIARAILSAVEEEREACAAVIDASMLCTAKDGSEVLLPRGSSGNNVGQAYASAIRNRKES